MDEDKMEDEETKSDDMKSEDEVKSEAVDKEDEVSKSEDVIVKSKLGFDTKTTKTTAKYPQVKAYSDIIDAMLGGVAFDKYYMYGHGRKYYKSKGAKGKETFANLFAIWSDGTKWEESKKYFPNLTEQFESIMKGVIDDNL
jgi:hypothetical protein